MKRGKPRLITAAVVLLAAVLLGCGTNVVDQEGAQNAVQERVENDLHVDFRSTECPKNEPITPGSTFSCTLEGTDGSSVHAVIRIENEKADLEIVKLRAGAGE